jgi:hypothetical protein
VIHKTRDDRIREEAQTGQKIDADDALYLLEQLESVESELALLQRDYDVEHSACVANRARFAEVLGVVEKRAADQRKALKQIARSANDCVGVCPVSGIVELALRGSEARSGSEGT